MPSVTSAFASDGAGELTAPASQPVPSAQHDRALGNNADDRLRGTGMAPSDDADVLGR